MDDLATVVSDLVAHVQRLEDELAIHRLIVSYGLAVDVGDAERGAAAFTADGVYDVDVGRMEGRAAVAAMLRGPRHQEMVGHCAHQIGPAVVSVLAADRAVATSYSRVYLATRAGTHVYRVSFNRWERSPGRVVDRAAHDAPARPRGSASHLRGRDLGLARARPPTPPTLPVFWPADITLRRDCAPGPGAQSGIDTYDTTRPGRKESPMRTTGLFGLAAILVLGAGTAWAKCDPTADPDKSDIAAARAAVAANCDCAGAASHGAYVKCSADTANGTLVNKSCKGQVQRCAARSTCGKPGFVSCCRTSSKGKLTCSTKSDASKCKAPKKGSACVSQTASCCDACDPNSTPPCSPSGAFLDSSGLF